LTYRPARHPAADIGRGSVGQQSRFDLWAPQTGLSVYTHDVLRLPLAWSEKFHNLKQYRVHGVSGHWASAGVPDMYLADVRDFFRPLR
jgi:hypothetical protein